jgi:AcrR family transcriptional regulator
MKNSNGGQAMPQRYEGKYTDHVSRNIVVAMENAEMSVEEFAEAAGVSDRTARTHCKSSKSIKMSLLERYAHVLHVGVTDLTSRVWIERTNWTGIHRLDTVMSAHVRSEFDPKYLAEASRHIDPEYLCVSSHYAPGTDQRWTSIQISQNPDLYGMTWQTECELNAEHALGHHIMTSTILSMFLIGDKSITALRKVVQMQPKDKNKAPIPDYVGEQKDVLEVTVTSMLTVQFRHSFSMSVMDEDAYPWLIYRKGWALISAQSNQYLI